jgi:hypothetical protein
MLNIPGIETAALGADGAANPDTAPGAGAGPGDVAGEAAARPASQKSAASSQKRADEKERKRKSAVLDKEEADIYVLYDKNGGAAGASAQVTEAHMIALREVCLLTAY